MRCPFKRSFYKEEYFDTVHKTSNVRTTLLDCDKDCMAYDAQKKVCKLIEPASGKEKKNETKPNFSSLYPSENPFCTYGLG